MPYSLRAFLSSGRITAVLTGYLLPIGLIALLAGLPFFPDRSLYHKFFYLFVCTPALVLLVLYPRRILPLLREPIFLGLLAFVAWVWLSISWSSAEEDIGSLVKWPLYVLLFCCAVFQLQQSRPRQLFTIIRASGLLILAATLYALIKSIPVLTPGYRMIGTGSLSNPLLSSHLFGFFAVYWILALIRNPKTRLLPLQLAAVLIMVVAVTATGSRTPLVALALVMLWLSVLKPDRRTPWLLGGVALTVGAALILLSPTSFIDRGASYRPEIWHKALGLIQEHLWIGHGYNAPLAITVEALNTTFSEPHNFALGVLYDLGIVGLALWVTMQALCLWAGWTHRGDWRFVLVSSWVIYGLGAGMTEGGGILSRPKEHWFLIWIPLAIMAALSATVRARHSQSTPKTLTDDALSTLCEKAKVIEADGLGPKVLKLADGTFLKIFRRKQWLSSANLSPYGQRFARHAQALTERQIKAPAVLDLFRLPNGATAVRYHPLPGTTLRQALLDADTATRRQLVLKAGYFVGQLHERGVYFRSLHLGNVLLLPDEDLALIDIADMRLFSVPLSTHMRQRNLKHMQRYPQDRQWLFEEHRDALLEGYALSASAKAAKRLLLP
ncbi:bifunctional O-antigen ligase/aminoglycoside phosphotransferase family protein [Pseudomonas oryzihabitans]|uniref:bifunctional O-antigen ligase/aminoglycoside phosphotransferase family protein n=1 Tax=Pseudomonas oryzihabitans TaxID=47885 RepID=UPI00123B3B41|nr:bifunctional O-antigen ligase/aminoglycoside phosphotransferase family protein [Pseudomonas oryzihabitans]QEU06313.1 polymerase [Pseudomonas oryzihabitans]